MKDQVITKTGTLLSPDNIVTHRNVEIAYHEEDGDKYIRVGSSLLWRKDVLEEPGRLTCLASGSVILL